MTTDSEFGTGITKLTRERIGYEYICKAIAEDLCVTADSENYTRYISDLVAKNGLTSGSELYGMYSTPWEDGYDYLKSQYITDYISDLICGTNNSGIRTSIECVDNANYSSKDYYIVPSTGFKSYTDYRKITNTASKQYALQQSASTTAVGLRQINGRYCIAVGTCFNTTIGQYIDVILQNGTIIPCVVADIKRDADTTETDIYTTVNGCCSEFTVDTHVLSDVVRYSGNISNLFDKWNSQVSCIRVYNKFADF